MFRVRIAPYQQSLNAVKRCLEEFYCAVAVEDICVT